MINTRLSIGIHILSVVALSKDPESITSEWIADSINTHPVVVRRMTSALKKADLVKAVNKNRGLQLTKEPERISFLDILQAVDPDNDVFSIHKNSNIECPVGRNIEATLTEFFHDIKQKTENRLAEKNLRQVLDQL